MKKPTVRSSEIIHTNPWFRIRHDILTWPNGNPGQYFVSEFPGASCIICVRDEKILTVTQYRHTMNGESIELPMGALKPGQSPLEGAKRELQEETGYQAAEWNELGSFFSLNGSCRNIMHVFAASDLTEVSTQREDSEADMTVNWLALTEWQRLIRKGKIGDGESLAAWLLWKEQAQPTI